jgi:hypothetical protein
VTKKKQSFVYVEEWGPSRALHGHLGGISRNLDLLRKTIYAAAKEGAYPNLKRIPKKLDDGTVALRRLRNVSTKHRYDGTWVDAWTYGPDWAPESRRITIKQVQVW